ncbi:unnamed protein product, partial [Ixodes persulcatus]
MAAAAAAAEFGAAVGCSRGERDTGRQVPLADRERAGGGRRNSPSAAAAGRTDPRNPPPPVPRARERSGRARGPGNYEPDGAQRQRGIRFRRSK